MAILGSLGDLVLALSADTAKFQSDLGRADRLAKKFGQEVGRSFDSLAKQIAALAGAGSIGLLIKSQIDAADAAGKMAQKIGISVESFSALKYAADLSDVSVEQLQMGMRKLATGMDDAKRGTGEAKDAFALLGIGVTDSEGKLKATDKTLLELAERFKKMEDSTGKTALATKLFGERVGQELIPFLNEGRDGIEKLSARAQELGLVFSKESAKAAQEFNDNLKELSGTVKGIAVQIAGPLVEAINKAAQAMRDGKKAGDGFFGQIIEGFRALVTGNDADKWNKEMIDLTDQLLRLKDVQDQIRRGDVSGLGLMGESKEQTLTRAKKEVAAAIEYLEERIKLHQRIKPILAPESTPPSSGGGTEPAPSFGHSFTAAELIKREEEVQQARRKALEESNRIQLDQAKAVNKQLEELDKAALASQIESIEVRDAIEAELGQQRLERVMALKQLELEATGELETQMLQDAHEMRLTQIEAFTEEELEQLGGKHALIEAMERQHQAKLAVIEQKKHDAVRSMEIGTFQLAVGLLQKFAGESKAAAAAIILIEKGLAIADIQIQTARAVMRAYADLGPVAGSAAAAKIKTLGMIQTGIVAATGIVELAQLSSGSSTPSLDLPPAGGVTVAESAPLGGGSVSSGQTTIINFKADGLVSARDVRNLLKSIEEATRDGGRVFVA